MPGKRLPFFEENTEPVARRVAMGLHKVGLAMKHESWALANEEGLSATQGQILALLATNGPLTATELGERLGLKLPTISDSVRVLVEKGLVEKSRDPRHPRASSIAPTKSGRAIGLRARSWPEFLSDAVGTLSAAEQRSFLLGLVKMVRALQEEGRISVNGMCVTCTHFQPRVREGALPHHCSFVDAPLADEHVRFDCPEQEPASDEIQRERWATFVGSS